MPVCLISRTPRRWTTASRARCGMSATGRACGSRQRRTDGEGKDRSLQFPRRSEAGAGGSTQEKSTLEQAPAYSGRRPHAANGEDATAHRKPRLHEAEETGEVTDGCSQVRTNPQG